MSRGGSFTCQSFTQSAAAPRACVAGGGAATGGDCHLAERVIFQFRRHATALRNSGDASSDSAAPHLHPTDRLVVDVPPPPPKLACTQQVTHTEQEAARANLLFVIQLRQAREFSPKGQSRD